MLYLVLVLSLAAVMAALTPVPIWVSRALRPALQRRALPPASDDERPTSPKGQILLTEINTAVDLVGRAWDSMCDYAVAAPVAWLLDRGAQDNWVKAVVRRSQIDEAEAVLAVERVVAAISALPPPEHARLEDHVVPLTAIIRTRPESGDSLVPGRVLARAEAKRAVQLLETTLDRLHTLRTDLLDRDAHPYR